MMGANPVDFPVGGIKSPMNPYFIKKISADKNKNKNKK